MEVIHIAEEYPIALKEHGVSFLMDNRHLWLRSKKQYAIMKVRQNVIKSIRDFFDTRDFVLIDSPMFTGNAFPVNIGESINTKSLVSKKSLIDLITF